MENINDLLKYYYEDDIEEIKEKLNGKEKEKTINYLKGYIEFNHQNFKEALKFFEDSDDTYYLGLCYLYGLGCKPKEKKAFKLLRDNLDDKVNIHLALMLLYGYGCNKDAKKAYDLVIEDAKKDDLKSMLLMYKYYELNHDEIHQKEYAEKIVNSNDYSVDFAIYFNDIYLDILLKNNAIERIKKLVKNAIENEDLSTYEKVISYYYDNKQYKEVVELKMKRIKPSRDIRNKIKNANRLYKAKRLDPNVEDLKEAKGILRIYHIKMLYLGSGFGCYIVFSFLYLLYFLMFKNGFSSYYTYLILGSLFGLASLCLLFLSTRVVIKQKYDGCSFVIIFNELASLLLIMTSVIISYSKYDALIPFKSYPSIVIIITHIVFTFVSVFLYFKNRKSIKRDSK